MEQILQSQGLSSLPPIIKLIIVTLIISVLCYLLIKLLPKDPH